MNTKSIFALLPIDIKENISDKLCEPDKQIHKRLMEELLIYFSDIIIYIDSDHEGDDEIVIRSGNFEMKPVYRDDKLFWECTHY
tara:strand:+ start:507 stop:758 length:252 start_codon:yes stop_codon:yes gene_type:complete